MSRIMRVVVLVTALMSLFAVMSSAAGAVTWDNSGDTSFTATAGPGSLSGNGKTLSCTSGDGTGVMGAAPFTGSVWTNAAHGDVTFTGCSLAGTAYAVTCTYGLNATGQTGTVTAGTIDLASPNGCTAKVGGVLACNIHGSNAGSYTNPTATVNGSLAIAASTTSITVSNGVGTCPLGNGTNASLTAFTFAITAAAGGATTPHRGPVITRTP
jgi:hypothetical protein